jgi:hypothetical protein
VLSVYGHHFSFMPTALSAMTATGSDRVYLALVLLRVTTVGTFALYGQAELLTQIIGEIQRKTALYGL